jgi:hypothetical protein
MLRLKKLPSSFAKSVAFKNALCIDGLFNNSCSSLVTLIFDLYALL